MTLQYSEYPKDAQDLLNESILGHRLVSEVYLDQMDYSTAVSTAENGLRLLKRVEIDIGRTLPQYGSLALIDRPPKMKSESGRLLNSRSVLH